LLSRRLAPFSSRRLLSFRCPAMRGGNCDRLFCRHFSSLSPLFCKDLLTEETFCLLDAACATTTFNQWERCITGFTVAFCCSPWRQAILPTRLTNQPVTHALPT